MRPRACRAQLRYEAGTQEEFMAAQLDDSGVAVTAIRSSDLKSGSIQLRLEFGFDPKPAVVLFLRLVSTVAGVSLGAKLQANRQSLAS
jgi:hypothetical protein